MEVLHRVEKLNKVVPREPLVEAALLALDLDERKQVSLLNKFEHNEEHLNCPAWLFNHKLSVDVVIDQLYDVGVVHRLDQVDFIH